LLDLENVRAATKLIKKKPTMQLGMMGLGKGIHYVDVGTMGCSPHESVPFSSNPVDQSDDALALITGGFPGNELKMKPFRRN
jgi:hypothetical protein